MIRFFAAAWVYSFHSNLWIGKAGLFADLSSVGYSGVSVFYVLSGFILSYNYLDREFSKREFWAARIARILPVYWLSLILAVPWIIKNALERGHFSAGKLALTPLCLQSWIPAAALSWNPPSWTVSTEAFFYFVFPFIAVGLVYAFRRRPIVFLAGLWILSTVPSLIYALNWPEGPVDIDSYAFWLQVIKFNPLIRLPEFLFGVCVGAGFMGGWRVPRPKLVTAACVAAICMAIVSLRNSPYPMVHNGLCAPLFALMILSIASAKEWLDWAPLVMLGEASYSLYLLSSPVYFFCNFFAKRFSQLPQLNTGLGYGLYFLISIACSLLVYFQFEKPWRRKMRMLLSSPQSTYAKVP